MPRLLQKFAVGALALYPFAVYFGLRDWGLAGVAPLLLVLFALRFPWSRLRKGKAAAGKGEVNEEASIITSASDAPTSLFVRRAPVPDVIIHVTGILSGAGAALVALAWLFNRENWMLYYPVAVNAFMLATFAWSLTTPASMIERFARVAQPGLPERAARYTRRVTQVWCGFFVLNGGAALATCLIHDIRVWTLYNGFISYALIGALFAGEWFVRRKVMAKEPDETPPPPDGPTPLTKK
jgi:uncharacterized membrane protein